MLGGSAFAYGAHAQDIEPRAYSNAPVGVNFLVASYAYTRGGLSFDPAVSVTNAKFRTSSAVLGYATVLDLWGKSAKFDVIVGASIQVSVPSGQYDASRVVNIGTHRWSFKPEVGASKALGPWTLEITAGVTLYTDNTEFYGGTTRSQDPLYSVQSHVIYGFRSGAWASMDMTYFTGGRTTLGGTRNDDLQKNWRAGATLALPVDVRNSGKLYASRGVSARTGNNFDLVGVAWQYRWGGGL